ncbi:phosphate ABC transporter permease subunit PstC [Actinobacteria bacterium YIM 96077]|uniref:Phosphate transport system permease protein n=1 Tax=Phytoactinopolyspora halophila TaxID=1981511 RepID=A0A329R2M4_9ACTN|nr:phosphate ABC transporter permease subunit PstC [Phytoactinopolyspora halophila]AYY11862.1 phosphate ABC transporter permease subunit PstC [Actinobacteria bacterium YIM 96077]RAW18905.1 phosphate ABC transporter permease subunit PstC [Phytoactinopolyspora halophila]
MASRETVVSGTGADPVRRSLEATGPRYGEKVIKALLALCGVLSVLITTAIVLSLLTPTLEFFREVSLTEFLFGTEWAPSFADAHFGVLPIVVGTLNVVFWAMVVAVPVGLGSAIYLAEYAPPRVRKVVKPMLEVLEGIPTVTIGLFTLLFLIPLAADVFPFLDWSTFSIGVAGIAVGLLTVPLVASVADDALRAVPGGLRDGAYALGAGKLRVSLRVILPAAISGIVAGFVLAISRAIGETMVVLMAAGNRPQLSIDPTESVQTMTGHIGSAATGDLSTGTIDYYTVFSVAALLFVMTLLMNVLAMRLVRRFREVYE